MQEKPKRIRKNSGTVDAKVYYLFVLVAIAAFFMIGSIVSANIRNLLKAHIAQELSLSAKAIADKINGFLEAKKGRVLDFCSDGIIKDGLTFYDPDSPDVDDLVKHLNYHLRTNKRVLDRELEDILILNLKGKVVFSSNETFVGRDKSHKDYFLNLSRFFKDDAVLKKLRTEPSFVLYVSDCYFSDDFGGVPAIAIANIVTARETGLPLGILVNRYKAKMLTGFLKIEENTLGETGRIYLMNKEKALLTLPKAYPARTGEVILKERVDILPAFLAQTGQPQLLGAYRDFLGKGVFGAVMLMEPHDWIIVAEEGIAEIFAPLRQLTLQMAAIGLVSVFVFVFLSFLISYLHNRVEAKARQLEEMKNNMFQASKMSAMGQMASSVAHEINNPLTGVLNNIQLIKMVAQGKEGIKVNEVNDLLNAIEESAIRCVKISRSLLDFSHASKGQLNPVSLNEAVEKVAALVEHELKLADIVMQKSLKPDLPPVSGDIQLLQQAIFDLINNARHALRKKFKKEGGIITLKTNYEAEKGLVCVNISDNGTGIAKENMEQLFKPFFTTKPVGEGTGLGLTIVSNIIKQHQGTIGVDSRIGEGTTFTIAIPSCGG